MIARDGNPTIVHIDPLTGRGTAVDPAELEGLSPAEAKAYVAHFAIHGTPPPEGADRIEPHPYLGPFGQWRMSDTNEPVWPGEVNEPLSPGQYIDLQGLRRWSDTNQLVEQFPNRSQYQDDDGVWRWADTGEPADPAQVDRDLIGEQRAVRSELDADGRLVREASRMGSSHQRSIDALTTQLSNGNLNPGIGTKHLFSGVFEARARDGARVYFKVSDDEIVIVGKSTKSNQRRVIDILEELYG